MGLDMYLRAARYVSGWNHADNDERGQFAAVTNLVGLTDLVSEDSPSATVTVTVAYWRKANAIHRWFVENVQDGKDECLPHYVAREQLAELRDLCRNALASREKVGAGVAADVLPTQSGFFFGPVEYDDWYWQGIEYTADRLTRVLAGAPDSAEFEYQSSW